jgi:hypothetical protein
LAPSLPSPSFCSASSTPSCSESSPPSPSCWKPSSSPPHFCSKSSPPSSFCSASSTPSSSCPPVEVAHGASHFRLSSGRGHRRSRRVSAAAGDGCGRYGEPHVSIDADAAARVRTRDVVVVGRRDGFSVGGAVVGRDVDDVDAGGGVGFGIGDNVGAGVGRGAGLSATTVCVAAAVVSPSSPSSPSDGNDGRCLGGAVRARRVMG